jgi:hypothetical protein
VAIANFFDRVLLSAAQAIQGVDPDVINARLQTYVVELSFDRSAASSMEGRLALDMAVRLLSRLYPTIKITGPDREARLKTQLQGLARAINPGIKLDSRKRASVRIVFGNTECSEGPQTIYAGSNRWLAKVSSKKPQGCGKSSISFGAGAAACLAAANAFRFLFSDLLPAGKLDEKTVISLFDFSTGEKATQGPSDIALSFDRVPLAGAGAIGNSVIWALARCSGLGGTLHIVDHESVELSNLQRYVLATQKCEGRSKVNIAEEAFKDTGSAIAIEKFPIKWARYIDEQCHRPINVAMSALDSVADRIGFQSSLPAIAINAWTQTGDLGISRHSFVGNEACLACLYLPQRERDHEDVLIARALSWPTEPQQELHPLRELLVNGRPVGSDFVRTVAARLGVDESLLAPYANEPLRSFYIKAVCGGAILAPSDSKQPLEVPLAFQSALAGIMLAAELVLTVGELRPAAVKTKTVVDLLRPIGEHLNFQVAKPATDAQTKCICQDSDFIAAYRQKHGLPKTSLEAR